MTLIEDLIISVLIIAVFIFVIIPAKIARSLDEGIDKWLERFVSENMYAKLLYWFRKMFVRCKCKDVYGYGKCVRCGKYKLR